MKLSLTTNKEIILRGLLNNALIDKVGPRLLIGEPVYFSQDIFNWLIAESLIIKVGKYFFALNPKSKLRLKRVSVNQPTTKYSKEYKEKKCISIFGHLRIKSADLGIGLPNKDYLYDTNKYKETGHNVNINSRKRYNADSENAFVSYVNYIMDH